MDLSSLFSISDNLYKFMFVGGIVMVIFSVTYPMQKKQLIDIEVNTYNQQATLLNKDISDLYKQIGDFKQDLPKLKPQSAKSSSKIIKQNIAKNTMFDLDKKVREVNTKSIVLKYNLERVKILKNHIKTYDSYTCWLTWIGISSGVVGFIMWSISTWNTERLKIKEINTPVNTTNQSEA